MTTATRQEVLGLYRRIFRLARKWQAASGQMEDTIKEKQYILNEARTLFQKNRNLTDTDLIKQCIDECTARIEIGLHYQIPYPRPVSVTPDSSTSYGPYPTTRPGTSKPGEIEEIFQTSISQVSR
ncbi:LYR motif-containing protein 1 isoform X1 [Balaenoptera acutorostrata]|uniref:LYR motif-containing protein 1 isoform X1 n=1 Tax=Balaenoptera acutorostrata TaxID=9767 RepID=A0ABM3S541_BALAC|nr:LYR motif-containing protein 1 isoform X1 [Balaenoptera acutorostrata]XP_057384966.1 LYR motif-containing protein 1 isoform X1 [Balaenoptera acutorostrata]XP_057384967.1 LYR motif-containing protein 1 isoform X1 [Balaenoptera acutorostrata]XP_057384968.1 LYR motif-containing protein 1 isoform X1 [Balaenoptera acutorostrata]XP_057384969.1 LYR motif-containing protein 1 isoform X1 [Balaenoptera acutorostrata]XP_057384971.1 LYR motif-containing protein 1 isoform X1 [Balaenoptera acutorostrata]